MPSARYYRTQARLLFSLSLTTSDVEIADRYRVRGENYLRLSKAAPPDAEERMFNGAVDSFNDHQLRKLARPKGRTEASEAERVNPSAGLAPPSAAGRAATGSSG